MNFHPSDNSSASESSSTLPRTLEPEVMDDAIEVQEYSQMDHSGVNKAFVDDLINGRSIGPRVVDLGCGNAAIPVLLCQIDASVEVLGIDSSIEMLESARLEIELGNAQGRVFLEHADCKLLSGFDSEFANTVISNTVLHHIADPKLFLDAAMRLLAPGGRLFIRDLLRPANETEVEQLVAEHAASDSDYGKQLLRQSLHAALTLDEIRDLARQIGIDASAVSQTSDRHWTLDVIKQPS